MTVSICVPFYNCERFFPDMIRSVFAQTYRNWELILIDDGSTDDSLRIARSIDDPRVRVISDGENKRPPFRRNQAVSEARFDLIAVMDADDMMTPERLATQQRFFDDPQVQLVASATCIVDDDNNIQTVRNDRGNHDVSPHGILRYKYRLLQPTLLGRKQWFIQNQYNPDYRNAEDTELFLRSSIRGTLTDEMVRIVNTPLLFYREGGTQNLAKTLRWNRYLRRMLREYLTPQNFGLFDRIYLRGLWEARGFVYLVAAALGIVPQVKQFRERFKSNLPLLSEQKTKLQIVQQMPVPGMDAFLAGAPIRNAA
jgi:glycosyltransferase involved in cell wall biosynthesis